KAIVINRVSLSKGSAERADVTHATLSGPDKRAAVWAVESGAGESDYLLRSIDVVSTAVECSFQSSQIERNATFEKSGVARCDHSGSWSLEGRITHRDSEVVQGKGTAAKPTNIFHPFLGYFIFGCAFLFA